MIRAGSKVGQVVNNGSSFPALRTKRDLGEKKVAARDASQASPGTDLIG